MFRSRGCWGRIRRAFVGADPWARNVGGRDHDGWASSGGWGGRWRLGFEEILKKFLHGMGSQSCQCQQGVVLTLKCSYILGATPGRLMDYLEKGIVSLVECEIVILDKADVLLVDFEWDIHRIVGHCPETRQMLLFSATLPESSLKIAKKLCRRDHTRIQISAADPSAGIKYIHQEVHVFPNDRDKKRHLYNTMLNGGADRK